MLGNLYVPTGLLPATERTPDIFYANDPRSANTARATFLAYWHLPQQIRARLEPYLNKLICSVSPMAGGRRMEACTIACENGVPLTYPVETDPSMMSQLERTYIGRCSYRGQYAAIYTTTDAGDHGSDFSASWNRHVYDHTMLAPSCPLSDSFYHAVLDRPQDEGGFLDLFETLALSPGTQRDRLLALQLHNAAIAPYHSIPNTLGHELGHLLDRQILDIILSVYPEYKPKHPSPANPYPDILFHDIRKIRGEGRQDLNYFVKPREAWAELIGAALVHNMQAVIDEHFSFEQRLKTDGLAEVMRESYELICDAVEILCRTPQPRQTPALLRAPAR